MSSELNATCRFRYEAQTPDGIAMSGFIDAPDAEEARARLGTLGLVVASLHAAPPSPPRSPGGPIRNEDLAAVNEQIAQITAAGMPLEKGLRLIASDTPNRKLGKTLTRIAERLESGDTIRQAIDAQGTRFPNLYGHLLEVGVTTGNPHGVLANLNRQLSLINRLRSTLWSTLAYPAMMLVGLVCVLVFFAEVLAPVLNTIFEDFGAKLPFVTTMVFGMADMALPLLFLLIVVVVVSVVGWQVGRALGKERQLLEHAVCPIPLLGRVFDRAAIAQWCGTMQLAVGAGIDLPRACRLAGSSAMLSSIRTDSRSIEDAVTNGQAISLIDRTQRLPLSVLVTMELAAQRGNLRDTLETLSHLYEQQAENRLAVLRAVLAPVTVILMAGIVGLLMIAITAPLGSMVSNALGGY